VIAANGRGDYWTKAFAHADDKQAADGAAVLTYEQAANKARALARGDANAAADAPVTITEAIDGYEADLLGRGRDGYVTTCQNILRRSRCLRSPASSCARGATG
jgi:hypothetical protein